MKYLKQKLMAAVAMLAVSTVMLTSASYAWFTISTTPEVKNVKTTITANENFEIALGTTGITEAEQPKATTTTDGTKSSQTLIDQTWGATVLSLDALAGLGPATIDGGVVKSTVYGVDGRPAGYTALTPDNATFTNGVQQLKDAEGNVVGQKILLWLRTNKAGNVTVDVTNIKIADEAGANPVDAKNKVQVAFDLDANGGLVAAIAADATASTVTGVSLGAISADVATPVYVYVYLEGANVTNADVEAAFQVTIESIKFHNSAVADAATNNNEYLNIAQSSGT